MEQDTGVISRGTIVIWHGELVLSVGLGEGGPCPADLMDALLPEMTFTKIQNARAGERRDPANGDVRRLTFEKIDMYTIEAPVPRLACMTGYLARVIRVCGELGYAVDLRDVKFHGNPDDRPNAFAVDWQRLAEGFRPRARQDECLAAMMANWYGRIEAAPGFGKTYMVGAQALAYPNAEIILSVPGADTMHQAVEHISNYIPTGEIGRVGDGYNDPRRVSVYIINSLAQRARQVRPDILAVDEAHTAATDKWSEAIMLAGRRARIYGLSGSFVPRFDNAHARYEALFGETIFRITAKEATAAGLTVQAVVFWHDVVLRKNPVAGLKDDTAIRRHGIWRNRERNALIARVVGEAGPETRVLVLCATVEHALELAALLPESRVVVSNVSERLEGSVFESGRVDPARVAVTARAQKEAIGRFRDGSRPVLISNGKLGVGFSPDELQVLVRCDAQASEVASIQWSNRGTRTHAASGKDVTLVHDFLDQFEQKFKDAAAARMRVYEDMGFKQVHARDGSPVVVRRRKKLAY